MKGLASSFNAELVKTHRRSIFHHRSSPSITLCHRFFFSFLRFLFFSFVRSNLQESATTFHHHAHAHHPHYHQQQHQHKQLSPEEIRTIWLGDLHHWMDETFLHNCFAHTGEVVSAKVIRNKQTGVSEGYGFVEFYSRGTAEKVLQNFNGAMMPNTDQAFRLNWATFSAGGGGHGISIS